MSIFTRRTPKIAITLTTIMAAIAIIFTFAITPDVRAQGSFQVLDGPTLPECDVQITKYQNSYRVRLDVHEQPGDWKTFFITVDGVTNENRQWPAFRTDTGIAFYMPYNSSHSGEQHHYFVRVAHLGRPFLPPICESTNSFYVKGIPPDQPPDQPGTKDPPTLTPTPDQSGTQDPPTVTPTPAPEPEPRPEDLIVLRECDITITRYVDSFHVRMDINERKQGRMYWPTIDGITNENRGWGAFRTPGGIAFVMRYSPANAGEVHEYLVRVAPWYQPNYCESRGTFYVKG